MKSELRGSGLQSALHLLHRAGQCADELFAINTGSSDLTPRQFAVLKAIAGMDDPSQTDLVERTGIDRSTMADIVRRMLVKGMVQRRRTRQGARMYAVRLTEKGRAALDMAEPAVMSTDERILATLPAAQRDVFLRALTRIVEAMSTPPAAPGAH
jgi:DNA-binding MarR family transcriptional regulator